MKFSRARTICVARLLLALFTPLLVAEIARSESVQWIRQLGTSQQDDSLGVSADGLGNVYISGFSLGSFGGSALGNGDAFVSKYDEAGNFAWSRRLGTTTSDTGFAVSADGLGSVYISGLTFGNIGGASSGLGDAFVSKYDAAGNLSWSRQLGSNRDDVSYGLAADRFGNVYVGGYTEGNLGGAPLGSGDAFLTKFDASGSRLWTRQFGTSSYDEVRAVAVDGLGNVYATGDTDGNLDGTQSGAGDAIVRKYDSNGNLLWGRQIGTVSMDTGYGVAADGLGNVYIAGTTEGALFGPNAGLQDAFVSKFDVAGNLLWTRQLGTSSFDEASGIAADAMGNVYISGDTGGKPGAVNSGTGDSFMGKYDPSGNLRWIQQLGTRNFDSASGVSADGLGHVYITGYTSGSLGGPNAGSDDAYIAKISDVPEPSGVALTVLGGAFFSNRARRREQS